MLPDQSVEFVVYKVVLRQVTVGVLLLFSSVYTIPLILISQYFINLLKPTGHVMYQQFNIKKLYALPTLYLCVLYLSENKQRLVPLTA